ncbi:hypothetical protein CDL12_20511 [Handroanthus impetiginosus]|uniref:Protein TIFY n=1 Tax=Handroanthus impetiginosus TaxID=429701 RepID=A0A2G9FZ13_9LAMI|nr:hypothetical protein CDL12_29215 [Handroanthus impetiginosus]PIN06926.1 hypothetical protein CDL12_20511 [Handroanthus impetiginosus]
MKRNCNLELRLVTPSVSSWCSEYSSAGSQYSSGLDVEGGSSNKKQKLTVFYNGRVAVCDATEVQARTIIWLASHEVEQKSKDSPGSDPSTPLLTSPIYSPTGVSSMKRSLQSFLQKRKIRAQATSPYPNNITHHSNEH